MSKDIIYREDAIEVIHSYWKSELSKMPTVDSEYGEVIDGDYNTLLKYNKELSIRIKNIPSADRPQGTYTNSKGNVEWYAIGATCNLCGERWMGSRNYCPNCGAYMKGADDEMS